MPDSGANANVISKNFSVPWDTGRTVDMVGINNHTVNHIPIVHGAAVAMSDVGNTIVHAPESAYLPDGKSILSTVQMESLGCKVVTLPADLNNGIPPHIETPDGYRFPLKIVEGLAYLEVRPVLDDEWDTLPHTYLTADEPWDPRKHDHGVDPNWNDKLSKPKPKVDPEHPYDEHGRFKGIDAEVEDEDPASDDESSVDEDEPTPLGVNRHMIMAHVTDLIEDELETSDTASMTDEDSFIHFGSDSDDDDDHKWQPIWETNMAAWSCYDVTGRPRRSTRKKVNYNEKALSDKSKPKSKGTKRTRKTKTKSTEEEVPDLAQRDVPVFDDAEYDDDEPRTDYNNPAKSMYDQDGEMMTRELKKGPIKLYPSEDTWPTLSRYFGGTPLPALKKTWEATTQLGRIGAVKGLRLYQRRKAPNPALNIPRRNEPVATDEVYAGGVPAVDNGSTTAQYFVGRLSGFHSVEGLGRSSKRFPTVLMNHIRKYGAMDMLVSDGAKQQISKRVKEILGVLHIKDWQSEPRNPNQNFAERAWQQVKQMTHRILDMSDAPSNLWLAALEYACFILNHTATERLNWRTPTEWLLGYTPDISVLLQFEFYEPVYYQQEDGKYPADPTEKLGRFVGISETVGNSISYKILTEDQHIIVRSVVRSAKYDGAYQNARANERAPKLVPKPQNVKLTLRHETFPATLSEMAMSNFEKEQEATTDKEPVEPETVDEEAEDQEDGEITQSQEEIIRSAMEHIQRKEGLVMPTLNAEHLLNRTFITLPNEEMDQTYAKIEEIEATGETTADGKEPLFKFRCSVGDNRFDEVMTYNRMLEWCNRDMDLHDHFRIDAITDHKYENGKYKVWVEWADARGTWEPLANIAADDPITTAMYGKRNNLLNQPGWKHLKSFVKNAKVIGRMVNQTRLKNYRNKPVYKYGVQVPRSHQEAVLIDQRNGDTKWQDSEDLEVNQLLDYDSFESLGKGAPIPEGYKKIPYHFVYDVKHDGRRKSRLVAGGHRTDTPVDSVYSGVVSLQGVRIITFLAELNDMELWGTDIGNAYLESYTTEKVAFIAGPEFGKLEGHTMIVRKAQYGLKSSGKCWHDKLHDTLRSMGFFPSKAEEDIWMRDMGDHYEYIACYVDDLLIASHKPQSIIDQLTSDPINFKLKGTGPLEFHLGCNYYRDPDGTLCQAPVKYIDRMVDSYKNLFGSAPKQTYRSPLEKNDHPELDNTPLLDEEGIKKYQSLIGSMQWAVSLGRFDVATAVMTMSSFRVAPREGHLERLKRMCGYLYKFNTACIRYRTNLPDYSDLQVPEYDWARSVYGDVREQRPLDAPAPKGKLVRTTTYKDANLYHDLATGRAVTGVLHFLNGTPIDWYTKKQPTVETATYGSEFAAAKVAIQQIAALRIDLQYLGVNIDEKSYLFGDNESVVKSSTIPQSQLSKRHHALAYHFTREAVASGMVVFAHIRGTTNPADILSKHWDHASIYPTLRPILFWKGDTLDLIEQEMDAGDVSKSKGGEQQLSHSQGPISSEC